MKNEKQRIAIRTRTALLTVIISLVFVACSTHSASSINDDFQATAAFENALLTATFSVQMVETPTPVPEETAFPTSTITAPTLTPEAKRTPPALPGEFQTTMLNPKDIPHTYLTDTCEYLKKRWDPNNSAPGTVVMPIMFHSITDGEATKQYQISHEDLETLVRDLVAQGFEAITLEQLRDFLYFNAKIPPRSVLLIVDDRHHDDYYYTHFKQFYEEYGWTVVNAWISGPDTLLDSVLQENKRVEDEGWVNHQAHGVLHFPIEQNSSEDYMLSEIMGSMRYVEEYFGKESIAYIWAGGGFSARAVQIAREAGFELGFTTNPRGPIMFNWIPLADEKDEGRPVFLVEGDVSDPLMVLPRFWDQDARNYLDRVRTIGKEANTFAMQNKFVELEYYDIVCKGITGEISSSSPE